jgi:hypothetical protein
VCTPSTLALPGSPCNLACDPAARLRRSPRNHGSCVDVAS